MSCKYNIGKNSFDTELEVVNFIKSQQPSEFLGFLKTKLDTQQTVARKYEEIAEILKKEKPVEVVTDENGFDWYEAKIEQSDVNKPVVAFQKAAEPIEQPTAPQQNYKEQLFQEMQGYKKAEVFMEVDGEIVQAKNTNTAVILPLVAKQIDDIEDINKLQQYDLEILQANQEDTVKILKGIETDLIAQGIDVAGLADKEIDADLMSFLGELEVFINNPTVENTKAFVDVYDAYFEKDLSPKTEIIKAQETDRDFVKLNTNLSEEQVYEQQGLIKVKDGLYIRTNKQDLNTLYSSLETYTEKYPKDTNLKEYVQTQIATSDFKNSDKAEAVYLYKMYFDITTTNEKEAVKTNANFTGNYEYLTTEFVSDFYIEMLKEREKNSEIYKNFYSNFDINENGIYLKNEDNITMSQVREYADENLKQYSIISKQMPLLTEQEIQSETKQVRRDAILNSPQNLEKYQGQYHKLNDNNLILKNSNEEFIKVGGNIFEAVDIDGNLTLYSRLNSVVGEYNTFENEAPKTNVKIEDYSYLNTQPEKFLTEKSYLSKSAKEKINKENFDCI